MVSLAISSPPKVPPLSYAEQAKKAQNIKYSISAQPNHIVVQSPPSTNDTPAIASDSSASPPNSLPNPLGADVSSSSSTNPATPTDARSPASPTTDASNVNPVNGNTRAKTTLASKALSVVAAHTSQKSPVVNVWNIRKEQLAAARAALTKALEKEVPPQSQAVPPLESTSGAVPGMAASKPPSAPNPSHGPSAMNGVIPTLEEAHDPFSVRLAVNTTRIEKPLPPPVDDTHSWPEVGKAAASIHSAANISAHGDDSANRTESESDQSPASMSRRGEKSKWVPIPPKELQATADALAKPSKRQSRKGPPNSRLVNHTANGSTSGSAQSQSRGHSATQSVSHSRVQSRSESLQSSPHIPRERLLQADDASGTSGQGAVNPRTAGQSSRPSSPPSVVGPHRQPSRSGLDLNIPPNHEVYPSPGYSQVSVQTPDDPSSSHPPSVQFRHSTPYTQQRYHHPTAHVPMHPNRNSQSGTPPLPTVHYSNTGAPYSMHAPHAAHNYNPAHIGHWNTNLSTGSGTHSPAYPPPQAGFPYYLTHFALTYAQQQQPRQLLPLRTAQGAMGELRPRPSSPEQVHAIGEYKEGVLVKEVVFGSIGLPGASQSPSPAPLPSVTMNQNDSVRGRGEGRDEDEKAFTMFSIGVAPGDGPLRLWARTLSSKAHSRMATASTSDLESRPEAEGGASATAESKVIDLTDSQELKWEFGTTSSLQGDGSVRPSSNCSNVLHVDTEASQSSLQESVPPVLPSITGFDVRPGKMYNSKSGSPVVGDDDFEVKDFGYGFGLASGTGRATAITREEREGRERERIRELERERVEREKEKMEKESMERELQRELAQLGDRDYERDWEREKFREVDVPVRPRHGSYTGGAGYERGERGVRRARGVNGFGRGHPNRRGAFQQHTQQQRQPFTVTPPQAIYQPIQPMGETPSGYYPQPPYMYPGYEAYLPTTSSTPVHVSAPVPIPMTTITFPLDPTRWYLLGQLEYYLSPQNLAQDFFLRQQMDARGWVPVSLIASFNRVRQLTMDVHLVRDVLSLSSMVQVRGDWVRMNGWEQFVLPDAAASDVERLDHEPPETYSKPFQEEDGGYAQTYDDGEHRPRGDVHDGLLVVDASKHNGDAEEGIGEDDDEEYDGEEEEDDEEDVVFVMGHDDDGQPWPPERFTPS